MNITCNKKKFIIILFKFYSFIVSDQIFILNILYILDKLEKKINSLINYFSVHFP